MELEILNTKTDLHSRNGLNCKIGKNGTINFSEILSEKFRNRLQSK